VKIINRYEKTINEHRKYYRDYKENLTRENFKKFLSIQNKKILSFQILANNTKRNYESDFRRIFDQKLALEGELAKLEEQGNRASNSTFIDIKALINDILERSNFNYNIFTVSQNELFRIYKKLENLDEGLFEFDRQFEEVKQNLKDKLKISEFQTNSFELLSVKESILNFDLTQIEKYPAMFLFKAILEKVIRFKANLVNLIDFAGTIFSLNRRKKFISAYGSRKSCFF
jgi:hypothetical protein